MKVIKSGKCIVGICGTPTGMIDIMGKDLFVGDLVKLFLFYEDGRVMSDHGLTYVADGNFNTFNDGSVSCAGVTKAFIMGIAECELGVIRSYGGYWHVKKVKRYNIKERKSLFTPHTIEEVEGVKSFFRKDF